MSYRIDYRSQHGINRNRSMLRLPLLTVLSFLLFLFLVNAFWPEGAEYIRFSVSRFQTRTTAALNVLEEGVLYGEPLTAAFSDFFQSLRP